MNVEPTVETTVASRCARTLLSALLALPAVWPLAANAQSGNSVEPFVGTWSGVFTTQEHEHWTFADILCFVGCPLEFYNHLSALLADPANDAQPAMALAGRSAGLPRVIAPIDERFYSRGQGG